MLHEVLWWFSQGKFKTQPWANVNTCILHSAYLEQLGLQYNLDDELATDSQKDSDLSK
jgi:hypothetical protein